MGKSIIAYFSAQGNTKRIAEELQALSQYDLYEIKPKVPYARKDLNWLNPLSRSSKEMKNKDSRPEIITNDIDFTDYDTILLGFPIWWYIAPTIINTFLESYDFSHKKIVLFATSGGSDFGKTTQYLQNSVSSSTILVEGKLLQVKGKKKDLQEFLQSNK